MSEAKSRSTDRQLDGGSPFVATFVRPHRANSAFGCASTLKYAHSCARPTSCTAPAMPTHTYLFSDVRGFLLHFNDLSPPTTAPRPSLSISGSLVPGWQTDSESDLQLVPVESSEMNDPFGTPGDKWVFSQPVEPGKACGTYPKDVRAVAQRAEDLLAESGLADEARVGVELEFNLLRGIRFGTTCDQNLVEIRESDGWANNISEMGSGHRMGHRSLHFVAGPIDKHHPVRLEICNRLRKAGLEPTHHGHEAGPSQQEIAVQHAPLLLAADGVQVQKYIVRQVAADSGLTATFMPRPIPYAESNGMHVNVSLWRRGRNIFYKEGHLPGELSDVGLQFIAGILSHLQPLNAITNPTVNSYKRLNHFYSQMRPAGWGYRNRTTAIRVPHFTGEDDCRVEIRFPDPSANPYLALAALVCAGLEGIRKRITPPVEERGAPRWFEQPFNAAAAVDAMAPDLRVALKALAERHEFLTAHGVFPSALIDAIVQDGSFFWQWAASTPAPQEYQVFFSL